MLQFFRRYQRYVYFIITIVIVISFSFFGTYGALQQTSYKDDVAFIAVDGTPIRSSQVDQLVYFIMTDYLDKRYYGRQFGPNFLNDGVIRNDFLKNGLAQVVFSNYKDELQEELQTRAAKEKRYRPYAHPHAQFLRAEEAWNYFTPSLTRNLKALQATENPASDKAFDLRVKLYLSEQEFPAPLLTQVLLQQQQQYSWLPPDPTLQRADLSLFGYHTIEDWFGPKFVRHIAQFIINSAKVAEQKGYYVSKEEVLADFMENTQHSFRDSQKDPRFTVATPGDYLKEQLRMMGIDMNQAVKTWQQVLLFRRLFADVGNANMTDPVAYQEFSNYANRFVAGESYQLPETLRIGQFGDLQQLEMYLKATTPNYKQDGSLLLPEEFLSLEAVAEKYPSLVQRRYLIEQQNVEKRALLARVGVKEMWEWEVADENWHALQEIFPDLGNSTAETTTERYTVLENLSTPVRWRVDGFARRAIAAAHPEWVQEALAASQPQQQTIYVSAGSEQAPLAGIEKASAFSSWLDGLAEGDASDYSDEGGVYYKIKILEKAPTAELMTFGEARANGTLEALLNQELGVYYKRIREATPDAFQNADGSWKDLKEVNGLVASRYFSKLLANIEAEYSQKAPKEKIPSSYTPDFLASVRLYPQMEVYQQEIRNGTEKSEPSRLASQWLIEKQPFTYELSSEGKNLELFEQEVNSWSALITAPNGEIAFYKVLDKGVSVHPEKVVKKVGEIQALLSQEAQQNYAKQLVTTFAEKKMEQL